MPTLSVKSGQRGKMDIGKSGTIGIRQIISNNHQGREDVSDELIADSPISSRPLTLLTFN